MKPLDNRAGWRVDSAAPGSLPYATAFLQVNRRRRVVLGPRRLHGHSSSGGPAITEGWAGAGLEV